MADPTTQTRVTPVGIALCDGHATKITFAADTDVSFWEKTVQPVGVDAGDMIDITTMFNTMWMTKCFRSLKDLTDATLTVSYDPVVLDQIVALVGVNTDVTILHPNNDTWDFYGGLRSFTPQENSHGAQPEAQIVVSPTNYDPDANSENGPNYKTSVGTD